MGTLSRHCCSQFAGYLPPGQVEEEVRDEIRQRSISSGELRRHPAYDVHCPCDNTSANSYLRPSSNYCEPEPPPHLWPNLLPSNRITHLLLSVFLLLRRLTGLLLLLLTARLRHKYLPTVNSHTVQCMVDMADMADMVDMDATITFFPCSCSRNRIIIMVTLQHPLPRRAPTVGLVHDIC